MKIRQLNIEFSYLIETVEVGRKGLPFTNQENLRGRSPLSTTHMILALAPAGKPDPSSNIRLSM